MYDIRIEWVEKICMNLKHFHDDICVCIHFFKVDLNRSR